MKKQNDISHQAGFTLVELLVAVAILGILVSVSVPNYRAYKAKAKSTEAKMQLSAIYTAEVSFQSDADTFAHCLKEMGYNPVTNANKRYYAIGFAGINDDAKAKLTDDFAQCRDAAQPTSYQFDAERTAGENRLTAAAGLPMVSNNIQGNEVREITAQILTFKAGAIGEVLSNQDAPMYDMWTIDHNKSIRHVKTGW